MSDLALHLDEYLRLRRALGFKLARHGDVLPQFLTYLEAAGSATIKSDLAISWARLPQGVQPIQWAHRLTYVRGFARYMTAIDSATEVPPRDIFGARQQRPTPYLWQEDEVLRLIEAARSIRPPLRALSHEALFGLLWASGMRIGEAVGLERDDVDLAQGVIMIREAKFGRSRLVPLHRTTTDALSSYAARRDRHCPSPRTRSFFVSSVGTAMLTGGIQRTFNQITVDIGIRTATKRPRIHDLRHSFAVRTLIGWYRSGVDVDSMMVVLSAYLGHVNPIGTYWYLSAAPELMELAAARLEIRFRR